MEPLPPVKEVEYRCYISKIFEELSGSEYMTFAFETAKEFSSFRYEIAVRYRIQPGLLEFKVLGMTATRTMMPSFGTARSVLKVPLLPLGVYSVRMVKSDGTENLFSIDITKKGFQILQPIPRKRFIDLIVENKAAAPGARNLSTVSKSPPVPLVPRTIQKRQPPPMTPEELAIAAMLAPETHEEREAREEHELFGGNGHHNDDGHSTKSSAKHPIDEIEEVPVIAKPEVAKAKPPKAAKSEPAPQPAQTAKPEPKPQKAITKKEAPKPKPEKKAAQKAAPVKNSSPAKKSAPAKTKPKPKAKEPAKKSAPPKASKKTAKKR